MISPNHDDFKGLNVINSLGAIHHFTKNNIENCNDDINIKQTNNLVSIIIGGQNRHYEQC